MVSILQTTLNLLSALSLVWKLCKHLSKVLMNNVSVDGIRGRLYLKRSHATRPPENEYIIFCTKCNSSTAGQRIGNANYALNAIYPAFGSIYVGSLIQQCTDAKSIKSRVRIVVSTRL